VNPLMEKELISIVCPTLNEGRHIHKTIGSFLAQKSDSIDIEVLIVDGMSEDNTREVVKEFEKPHSNVHLVDNVQRKTPYAFNKGIARARGNYVAILGAHCYYDPDYLQTCYNELIKTGSAGCAGRVRLKVNGSTIESRLVKWIQESEFGVSSGSFKSVREGYTTMINFPVYRKSVLLEVGGYDTTLHRNQDNDLNQRVADKGYKLYHTWKTGVDYLPPDSLNKLLKYGYKNGFWNAKSMLRKPRSMKLHHKVPLIFVSALIISFALGLTGYLLNNRYLEYLVVPGITALILHLLAGFMFSCKIAVREKSFYALCLPVLFLSFHIAYGWGSVMGFLKK
jgi:succinoglycan biosynthesis protein ExoA